MTKTVKRIQISEIDRKSLLSHETPQNPGLANTDFSGLVVNKPWGYEYLMYQSLDVSIWMLYIKKGFATSMHCHPKKKTSLLLILGEAVCSTLNDKFTLAEREGLIFDKGVFHTTEAVSPNGIFVMEVETPVDKTDLFRLTDKYKREHKGYTSRNNITNKTYNYHYLFLRDAEESSNIFGKYKFHQRLYKNDKALRRDLKSGEVGLGILLAGDMEFNGQPATRGDLIDLRDPAEVKIANPVRILLLQERKNLIKLSDYVVSFFLKHYFNQVFLVSGGNLMHLLESVRVHPEMKYLCNHHEQASAMAAEGYARMTGKPGFVMVTSGPGGTNAITGVAGAWIDSIPMVVISGQSYHNQTIGKSGLRQLGVQEINIVDIVKPMTKYAVMVDDPLKIRYHLEKALHLASTGRPGPVWIDIPINIQLTMIEQDLLDGFKFPSTAAPRSDELKEKVTRTIEWIKQAQRPVILLGNGVRLAHAEKEFFELAEKLSIPILTSRNANDLIWDDHDLYVGRPGSFGQRAANFTVQNSDLLLAIGSRISLAVTGWAYNDFARDAKRIIVDIDETELKKPTVKPDLAIRADAGDFIREMLTQLKDYEPADLSPWKEKIQYWRHKFPVTLLEFRQAKDSVNTYYFLDLLSDEMAARDVVVTDMGMSFQCTMQGLRLKKGQRLFTSSGLASMGFGLPGAIGACVANGFKPVICITGDGGLQMNIQELQTVVHYKLPIKIFIFNNNGYTSIRETQRTYFDGYLAADPASGVSMPDMIKVAQAYGIRAKKIENQDNLKNDIREVLDYPGPVVCDIKIAEDQLVVPKQGAFNRPDGKTVPRPIEDMIPYQDREDLDKDMIIEPIPFDPYKEEV